MIRISASLIKDILTCTQRGYYRTNFPEQSMSTAEMTLGNVVHRAIELYWNDEDRAVELARDLGMRREVDADKAVELTLNFFTHFKSLCSPMDEIEKEFDLPFYDDVHLVGKLDRVDATLGTVIDWKTTKKPPASIYNDIQFIVYHYAFSRLYGREPTLVAYASLTTGKLIPYAKVEHYYEETLNEIIPRVVNTIKSGHHSRDGLYGMWDAKHGMSYSCYYCPFREFCWQEVE